MFSYITITNTFNTELTILNICLGLIRYSRLLFTGPVPHINCLPVTPFTTYQGNSYTTVRWKCCCLAPPAKKAGGAPNAAAEATNLLAPSKNISELDCFITHGRTLTLSTYSIIFLFPITHLTSPHLTSPHLTSPHVGMVGYGMVWYGMVWYGMVSDGRIKYKFNNKEKFLPSYY